MKYLVTACQHMLYININYESAVYLRTLGIGHSDSREFRVVGRRCCEVPRVR